MAKPTTTQASAEATPASDVFTEDLLDTLMQDTNGTNVYSNQKALFGYLPAEYNMVVCASMIPKFAAVHSGADKPNVDLVKLGRISGYSDFIGEEGAKYKSQTKYKYLADTLDMFRLAAMNFWSLTNGANPLKPETACLVSALRARWTVLGCIYTDSAKTINDPTRTFNEFTVVNANSSGSVLERMAAAVTFSDLMKVVRANIPDFPKLFKNPKLGMEMAVMVAEAVWNTSEYLFRTRGHHFKDEYIPIIKTILSAAFEGADTLLETTEWNHIFHTAIHPFGIKILPVMAAHFIAHGVVGNALIIRMDAAPNGLAAITTSKAVLDVVATEPWYPKFAKLYADQIAVCKALADEIMNNKYSYSLAAGLYGLKRITVITVGGENYTLEGGKSKVSAIATVGQGLINALKAQKEAENISGFSFENAKALAKHANTNPLLSLKVSSLVNMSLELLNNAKSLDIAANMAFPAIENPEEVD